MLTKVYLQTWEYESFKKHESWSLSGRLIKGRLIKDGDFVIEVMVPDEWITLYGNSAYSEVNIQYRR